jgi:cyclopropane fatty-acyl-phospholipid synthase-like methyltransferase
MPTPLPSSPSCLRNRDAILALLRQQFSDRRQVLEIGSGTGEHAIFFSAALPHLRWQTSDVAAHQQAIAARLQAEPLANCLAPVVFDVSRDSWPDGDFDAVFSANTCHIMAWQQVQAMFAAFRAHLPGGAVLCLYGPFNYGGQFTSASNAAFDRSLRATAPQMGVRDFEAVDALARAADLQLQADYAMPANNRLLVWRRT